MLGISIKTKKLSVYIYVILGKVVSGFTITLSADVFTDESGEMAEPDNAEACIEYPQYTTSIIGDTYRRVRVRILFRSAWRREMVSSKKPGHVIYQKCTTNINKKENWNCTGWEYLGRLPGF